DHGALRRDAARVADVHVRQSPQRRGRARDRRPGRWSDGPLRLAASVCACALAPCPRRGERREPWPNRRSSRAALAHVAARRSAAYRARSVDARVARQASADLVDALGLAARREALIEALAAEVG